MLTVFVFGSISKYVRTTTVTVPPSTPLSMRFYTKKIVENENPGGREGEKKKKTRCWKDNSRLSNGKFAQTENTWFIFTPKAFSVLTGAFKLDRKSF